MTPSLAGDIKRDEGCELGAYPDPRSALGAACAKRGLRMRDYKRIPNWTALSGAPWTIGVGHTGDEVCEGLVWTQAEADATLAADIADRVHALTAALTGFPALSDPRQDVLVNMAFNLGVTGLLKFHDTLAALAVRNYALAADQMLASAWAAQLPVRAKRLATQMRTGVRAAV